MTLRNRLLALSLLTLLLPWSGWKLLQELEGFLRQAQENAALSVARTLAGALPIDSQSQLLYAPERYAVLRKLEYAPDLDGFLDDWPDEEQGLELVSPDNSLRVSLMAGEASGGLYLAFEVHDESLPSASRRQPQQGRYRAVVAQPARVAELSHSARSARAAATSQ